MSIFFVWKLNLICILFVQGSFKVRVLAGVGWVRVFEVRIHWKSKTTRILEKIILGIIWNISKSSRKISGTKVEILGKLQKTSAISRTSQYRIQKYYRKFQFYLFLKQLCWNFKNSYENPLKLTHLLCQNYPPQHFIKFNIIVIFEQTEFSSLQRKRKKNFPTR